MAVIFEYTGGEKQPEINKHIKPSQKKNYVTAEDLNNIASWLNNISGFVKHLDNTKLDKVDALKIGEGENDAFAAVSGLYLRDQIIKIKDDIIEINYDIDNISGDIIDIKGDITTINSHITVIDKNIDEIEVDIDKISGDIIALNRLFNTTRTLQLTGDVTRYRFFYIS